MRTLHASCHDHQVTQLHLQINFFATGNKDGFGALWQRHVPSCVDLVAFHKLEFMLHVYFAIYPALSGKLFSASPASDGYTPPVNALKASDNLPCQCTQGVR